MGGRRCGMDSGDDRELRAGYAAMSEEELGALLADGRGSAAISPR